MLPFSGGSSVIGPAASGNLVMRGQAASKLYAKGKVWFNRKVGFDFEVTWKMFGD